MTRLAFWPALLLLPAIFAIVRIASRKSSPRTQAFTGPFASRETPSDARFLPPILLWTALALLVVALARPQSGFERLPEAGEGVDIVITLDVSGSMLADDYTPTRLDAAKDAALSFIEGRPTDRIGLVVYAAQPLSICPPTLDHATLSRFVSKASIGNLPDGTAIGAGLAVAARGLEYSQTARRVIILISDGMDNAGLVSPTDVARAIRTLHGDSLRVYTVAIGTESNMYGVDVATLAQVASITGGRLFDAGSPQDLQDVYSAIDSLEASTLPEEGLFVYRDMFEPFLVAGLILLVLSELLRWKFMKVVGD
ncbi:VWA domain-containing protein [Candidatus Fermentibacteria bacterium]|nr:VWA domain-containing protein [Candidatus Fermentibacteria bacterium]